MAFKIRDIFVELGIEADEDAIKRIDTGLNRITSTARGTAYAFTAISIAVGAATVGLGFFLKQAGEFEQATVAFETMLGSAEKAKTLLKDIQGFAAKTPFQFVELVQLSKRVLAFGFSMEEVIPTLNTLGNIASGVGKEKLPNLLLALGQVRAAGKLRGQEVRQFTEAGVPLIEQLSKVLNKPAKEIQGIISQGKVSFEDTRKALEQLAGPGGRFFNLMIKQSKTLLGAVSNTIDILQIQAVDIGNELLPAAKQVLGEFLTFLEVNKELIKTRATKFFKELGRILVVVFKVMSIILGGIFNMIEAFGGLERVITTVTTAFLILTGLQLLSAIGNITLGIISMVRAMKALRVATMLVNAALAFWPVIVGAIVVALALLIEDVVSFFQGKKSVTAIIVEEFKKVKTSVMDAIGGTIDEIFKSFENAWNGFKELPLVKFLIGIGSKIGSFAADVTGFIGGSPSTAPAAGGGNSSTSNVNVNSPISVTVPDGTPPELVGSSIQSGISSAFGDILRNANRDVQSLTEF